MTEGLSWWRVARRLEARVLAELRATPDLWKEYKRLNKSRPVLGGAAAMAFMLLIYGGVVLSQGTLAHQFNLALWTLISTAAAFLEASTIRARITAERDRLEYLPVPDAFLFDYALGGARSGTVYLGVFYCFLACVGLVALGAHDALSRESALGLLLLVPLQAITVYVMSLIVLAWLPDKLTQLASILFLLFALAAFLMAIWARGPLGVGLDWLAAHPRALLALPPAWTTYGVLAFVDGQAGELLWAAPLICSLFAIPRLTRSLRARRWAETPKPAEEVSEEEVSEEEVITSIRDGVWFAGGAADPSGWLDRAVLNALTPRQQSICRFLQPESYWTRRWGYGVAVLAAAPIVSLVFPLPEFFLIVLVCLGCFLGLPSFESEWSGLTLSKGEGGWSPRYAHYPLTYSEIVRVLMRVNGVRAVAFVLPAFALGTALGIALGGSLLDSTALPMKVAVAYACLFPALVVGNFLSLTGTNRVRCLALAAGFLWVLIAVTGLVLLLTHPVSAVRSGGSGLEFVFRPYAVVGGSILFTLGWVSYLIFPFVYRRTDLVRAIPPESAGLIEAQREAERQKARKK